MPQISPINWMMLTLLMLMTMLLMKSMFTPMNTNLSKKKAQSSKTKKIQW